jgi:hypothetical protein
MDRPGSHPPRRAWCVYLIYFIKIPDQIQRNGRFISTEGPNSLLVSLSCAGGAPKCMKILEFPAKLITAEALSALRSRRETIGYFRSRGRFISAKTPSSFPFSLSCAGAAPKCMKIFEFPAKLISAEALSALRLRRETIGYFRSRGPKGCHNFSPVCGTSAVAESPALFCGARAG